MWPCRWLGIVRGALWAMCILALCLCDCCCGRLYCYMCAGHWWPWASRSKIKRPGLGVLGGFPTVPDCVRAVRNSSRVSLSATANLFLLPPSPLPSVFSPSSRVPLSSCARVRHPIHHNASYGELPLVSPQGCMAANQDYEHARPLARR